MIQPLKVKYVLLVIAFLGGLIIFRNFISKTPSVIIGKVYIPVEIAKDEAATQKGLSGRDSLNPQSGMLFIFPQPALYRFWMKDMHFPIDIIWINNGKVVGINADISNEFNPANPRFYTPPQPAQYVLELNAGFAQNKNIAVGAAVTFKNIK